LKPKLTEANASIASLETQLSTLRETSAADIDTVKSALAEARSATGSAADSLTAALTVAESDRDSLKGDVVKMRAELEDAERVTQQVDGLKTAMKAIHADVSAANALAAERLTEIEQLKPKLTEANASITEFVASADAKEAELALARSQASAAQKTAAVLAASMEESQAKVSNLSDAQVEATRLTSDLGTANEELAKTRKELEGMQAAVAHVTENASTTSRDINRMAEELRTAQQEVSDARESSAALSQELSDAKAAAGTAEESASVLLTATTATVASHEAELTKLQQVLAVSEASVGLLNAEVLSGRETGALREAELDSLRASTAKLETEHAKSESDFQMFEVQLLQKIGQLKAAHDANVAAIRTELMRRNAELQAEVDHFAGEAETNRVSFEALALEQVTVEEVQVKQAAEMETMRTDLAETVSDLEKGRTYLEETTAHITYLKGQVERLQESLDMAREQLEPFVEQGLVEHIRVIPINPGIPGIIAKVNISVPAVILQNQDGDEFHSYQVLIETADGAWSVHKRYSELLALHDEVIPRIRGSQLLIFPPKKTFGSKSEKLAEERRLLFQLYLVMLLRLCTSDPRSPLHNESTKSAFLVALPFFGEETITMGALDIADGVYE